MNKEKITEMDLEPSLADIRHERSCGRTCRGCGWLKECDYCEDKFCGTYNYDDNWAFDTNGDIACPICTAVNDIIKKRCN